MQSLSIGEGDGPPKWACPNCCSKNAADASVCLLCDAEKPDDAALSTATAASADPRTNNVQAVNCLIPENDCHVSAARQRAMIPQVSRHRLSTHAYTLARTKSDISDICNLTHLIYLPTYLPQIGKLLLDQGFPEASVVGTFQSLSTSYEGVLDELSGTGSGGSSTNVTDARWQKAVLDACLETLCLTLDNVGTCIELYIYTHIYIYTYTCTIYMHICTCTNSLIPHNIEFLTLPQPYLNTYAHIYIYSYKHIYTLIQTLP